MHISEINIYPIKSLKGISVDAAVVEERGLQYDRRWMLTTPEGTFLTQREFPRLACVSVWIEDDGLGAAADRFGDVFIPFEPDTDNRQQVTIWQSVCEGEIYGGALNEWFSDVLGSPCQLVYMPDETRRTINPRFDHGDDVVSFADGYPIMVLSEASVADLNRRLAENAELPPRPLPPPRHRNGATPPQAGGELDSPPKQGGELFEPLPMNRFRPNFVVKGADAFAEDDWQRVRIGDAVFRSTKLCERCVVTTVDQAKGEFAGKEPLKTLASYRMAKNVIPGRFESLGVAANAVLFGQNLVAESVGDVVRVGDHVQVLEKI